MKIRFLLLWGISTTSIAMNLTTFEGMLALHRAVTDRHLQVNLARELVGMQKHLSISEEFDLAFEQAEAFHTPIPHDTNHKKAHNFFEHMEFSRDCNE